MSVKPAPKTSVFRHAQAIVYAVVGPEEMRFGLHKDLLCNTSPFFKAAIGGRFQEAALGEVALPDVDVAAFECFNEWLYTSKITEEVCEDDGLSPHQLYARDVPSLPQLMNVWELADYLLVPRLQNYVVDMMMKKMKRRKAVALADLAYIYERTETGSLMRKLVVDVWVWNSFGGDGSDYLQATGGVVPEEMGLDLLVALTRRNGGFDSYPFALETRYHVPELAPERKRKRLARERMERISLEENGKNLLERERKPAMTNTSKERTMANAGEKSSATRRKNLRGKFTTAPRESSLKKQPAISR